MKQWIERLIRDLMGRLQNSHKDISQIIYATLIGIFVAFFLLVITIYSTPKISKIYYKTFAVSISDRTELNLVDEKYISELLAKNKIIPITDVYDNTLDYYNTLITILVALLGVFAILSWISLRAKIKEDVKDEIEKFFVSPQTIAWFGELIKKQIDQNSELLNTDKEKLIDIVQETVLARIEKSKQEEIISKEE